MLGGKLIGRVKVKPLAWLEVVGCQKFLEPLALLVAVGLPKFLKLSGLLEVIV